MTESLRSRKRALPEDLIDNDKTKLRRKNIITTKAKSILSNAEDELILPTHYKYILDLFTCLDTTVNLLIQKNEKLFIAKVEKVIKERIKRRFTKKEFGQILAIYPDCYFYEPVKIETNLNIFKTVWKVSPNLSLGSIPDFSPRKNEKTLSLNQIIFRKKAFHEKLLDIVKGKHNEFLKKNKKITRTRTIRRWDSKFDLEAECPEINAIELLENSKIQETPLFRKFESSVRVSIEKSGLCKNLFQSDTTAVNKESVKENILKSAGPMIQTQLNMSLNESTNCILDPEIKTISNGELIHSIQSRSKKLPFHLRTLFDRFRLMDGVVQNMCKNSQKPYFSKIEKSMTSISIEYLGRISRIYPECYRIKWVKMIGKSDYDLQVEPELRSDCTESAILSPSKGYIHFDHRRALQRSLVFVERCEHLVTDSHRKYLAKELGIMSWPHKHRHPDFNADLRVPLVQPAPLPDKPQTTLSSASSCISKVEMFFPVKKQLMAEVIVDTKSARKMSVLDKIKLRNKKMGDFGVKRDDRSIRLHAIVGHYKDIWVQLKSGQSNTFNKQYLINLFAKQMKTNTEEAEKTVDLMIEIVPDWLEWTVNGMCKLSESVTVALVTDKLNSAISV